MFLIGQTLVHIETHTSNSLYVMFDIARKTGRTSHCANTMSQQSFNLVHTELFFSFFPSKVCNTTCDLTALQILSTLTWLTWIPCVSLGSGYFLKSFNYKCTYLVFFLLLLQVIPHEKTKMNLDQAEAWKVCGGLCSVLCAALCSDFVTKSYQILSIFECELVSWFKLLRVKCYYCYEVA